MKNPKPESTLRELFYAQKVLLQSYMEIEGLPKYPLDLSLKENQKIIKDFSDRFVEELAEAFQSVSDAYAFASVNQAKGAKELVIMFNDELGDAWCFMLELLLYSGIDHSEVQQYINNFVRDNEGYNLMTPDKPLNSLIWLCNYKNQIEGKLNIDHGDAFNIISLDEISQRDKPEWMGARRLSEAVLDNITIFSWYTVYALKKATNLLKSKAWSRSEPGVNMMAYQERLMDAFIMFLRYMCYIGKGEVSIYNTYLQTYEKNKNRIKDGY